jgi:uncharacterized protein
MLERDDSVKRKYADRANWRRILDKQFSVSHVQTVLFTGYVTCFKIGKVAEPLWRRYKHHEFCIANDGYTWIQHFPEQSHYVVTSMYDEHGKIIQWYIDVCKTQGLTEGGVPWFDDLYLDIVILPSGELILKDEEELNEALRYGQIHKNDFDLAWKTANEVIREYRQGSLDILLLADLHKHLWNRNICE